MSELRIKTLEEFAAHVELPRRTIEDDVNRLYSEEIDEFDPKNAFGTVTGVAYHIREPDPLVGAVTLDVEPRLEAHSATIVGLAVGKQFQHSGLRVGDRLEEWAENYAQMMWATHLVVKPGEAAPFFRYRGYTLVPDAPDLYQLSLPKSNRSRSD